MVRELESILASESKLRTILKKELLELKEKFGDERRTHILDAGAKDAPTHIEDLVPSGQTVVALSLGGYLKRLDETSGRNAGRDPIVSYIDAGTRDTLLLFTAKGLAYGVSVHKIGAVARRSDKGAAAGALVDLADDDRVIAALAVGQDPPKYLILATRNGQVKRSATAEYLSARGAGIAALRLDEGDTLVAVDTSDGTNEVLLSTRLGKAIRFKEDEIRPTGRVAGGVRGIKLDAGDEVLRGPVVPRMPLITTFTDTGYARRTPLEEYPLQGRDGGGVKAMRLGGKVGNAVAVVLFSTRGGDFECTVSGPKVEVVDGAEIPMGDRVKLGASIPKLAEAGGVLTACLSLSSVR
jgi:DNA gyrase/topoisomerase IV subunit A